MSKGISSQGMACICVRPPISGSRPRVSRWYMSAISQVCPDLAAVAQKMSLSRAVGSKRSSNSPSHIGVVG
jgi:hypothetical protein